jgi:hypothetical protein
LVYLCRSRSFFWSGYFIPSHASGPDMSFLHIHHSSTYIWSTYVIPPHTSGWVWKNDISGRDVCMWRNDISGPDGCAGMTYPDQMYVKEWHIWTRCSFLHIHLVQICHSSTSIWSGNVIPPHPSGPDMLFLHITYFIAKYYNNWIGHNIIRNYSFNFTANL